ncbi:DUF423 domain-containing protein [Paenibacillus crassostreae]|uniref:DUF423 domain-containing protein n=1 Tax=Paenibacillus crassostreae TaxID=1763538 RepID=A0A167G268_9BACL|nr:DUF423 domain-containing protein [Paenibacillus crassostreae]AOZ93832.1 hypothetical protein LPB68_17700 [Paenibacillus crassostreae]OAB77134.1 hypothetical protein PNBC_07035 [Paenibacillus crassostreae]
MQRSFGKWGTILMALSVGIGAFGAHLLEPIIGDDAIGVYETGVHYHMIHGLALLLVALAVGQIGESRKLYWAGYLFITGIILFSGSLYVLSISGIKVLGAITPLGGVAFIAGWICFLLTILDSKKKTR